MSDHEPQGKRAPKGFCLLRHRRGYGNHALPEEKQILELILLGAPLLDTLSRLCTLIDVQIGNVVSLVSTVGVGEDYAYSIAQSAMQFGLNVFSSTSICSRDQHLLGMMRIYCCGQRHPTKREFHLIDRVVHLAEVALRSRDYAEDFEALSGRFESKIGDSALEKPPFVN